MVTVVTRRQHSLVMLPGLTTKSGNLNFEFFPGLLVSFVKSFFFSTTVVGLLGRLSSPDNASKSAADILEM